MLQGTASNVGKSLLTAALCRIFLQDGLRPAPFKAQNMALNSFVTDAGEEIGRAQALQALAAGRRPDARMNPVLLKPTCDTGSQVIVMGRPAGHMRVAEYLRYKPEAGRAALAAYDSLAAEAGVMVLEGAGSPAEINLKAHDIVNMAMARHARARVLLIGDIDRGGAFAALLGTWELFDVEERALVAGFVLNKFRGEAGLLAPALEIIGARTERPFLGIVPWLPDLRLPEEDSVAFRSGASPCAGQADAALDVVLIDLPRISNFSDADPLRAEPDVRLRTARGPEELGRPDAVLLPGSGNGPEDMRFLESSGLAHSLRRAAADPAGPVLTGLCGGLRMLGLELRDSPEAGCAVPGLGLLPLCPSPGPDEAARRDRGRHLPTGLAVEGFVPRGGGSLRADAGVRPFVESADGKTLGWAGDAGAWPRIWGVCLHGVFDADAFRRAFLDSLRLRRGLAPLGRAAPYDLNPVLDRLAENVRRHLDMARIYALLGL